MIRKFKHIVVFLIFIPSAVTVVSETKSVTIPIIKNVGIGKFPITINELIVRGIDKLTAFRYIGFKNSSYCTESNDAITVNFDRNKICTAVNNNIKMNFSIKRWGFAVVRYFERYVILCGNIFNDKIRSVANFHGFFGNIFLFTTNADSKQSKNNQSYVLYKLKRYFLVVLSYIGIALGVICTAIAFKADKFRDFFVFGFAAFVFASIAHFSIEKEVNLALYDKPRTVYTTNETEFAFNMLMILVGMVIGLIVMYFLRSNKKFTGEQSESRVTKGLK